MTLDAARFWAISSALGFVGLALPLASCGTMGSKTSEPPPSPSSGAGPFRPLRADELGNATGAVLEGVDVESAVMAGEHLFYASFASTSVHRSLPAGPPFAPGPAVLTPAEAWEGAAVFDPWVVLAEDGSALLYYAAEGGIGLAEALAAGGDFSRVGLLLSADPAVGEGATPRRPTVVPREGGGHLMYYEVGERIAVASSGDGRAFVYDRLLDLALPDEANDPPEEAVGAPAALVAVTAAGRRVTRLYFRSERDDGTQVIGFAASLDGFTFERGILPALSDGDPDFPAPILRDGSATLLLFTAAIDEGERALLGAITPGAARL